MKITFGLIVFNAEFFLKEVLESIYPYAHKICIAEGPVTWWQQQGYMHSSDRTNIILSTFPDPDKKLSIVHSRYAEKDDQCRAWFGMVPPDTDYVWCVDADEIHADIPRVIDFLKKEQPTSVGFKSNSFFGGFDHIIGGFEQEHSFKRILKYEKGCTYRTHRQPTLSVNGKDIAGKDITGLDLYNRTGIEMHHYSYVSPRMVFEKIKYYEGAVISKGQCIENYFTEVWLKWVLGDAATRQAIEEKYRGVQEFKPTARGDCFTVPFTGKHPQVIRKALPELKEKFEKQLMSYKTMI
jgi:hypothetical protein